MADEKLNTGPGEEKLPEAPAPVTADGLQAPAPEQAAAPTPQQEGPAQPEPGDVVVSFDKINELMNEKRQTARAEVEKEEAAKEPEEKTQEEPPAAGDDKPKKARRGRPPKEEKAEPAGKEAAKPRKGRPPKADKAAPGEATPTKRDKLSRSGKKAVEAKAAPEPEKAPPENAAPAPEQAPPEPAAPPRPVEEGKLVYLKLSEMHPFHTFRPHPFKVRDDAKMQETVASIKANGVMVPGLARPEKDGNGYGALAASTEKAVAHFHTLSEELRQTETELEKTSGLMAATVDYAKTRPVFDGYKAARYSKKYLSEHEAELSTYRAARATMNELLDGAKLPKMADMKKARQELAGKKKALYAEYRKAQADMRQAVAIKANIDHLLGVTDGRENKAQER